VGFPINLFTVAFWVRSTEGELSGTLLSYTTPTSSSVEVAVGINGASIEAIIRGTNWVAPPAPDWNDGYWCVSVMA
jgi:hypothetical protein